MGRRAVWTHLNGRPASQFVNIRPSFIISGDSATRAPRSLALLACRRVWRYLETVKKSSSCTKNYGLLVESLFFSFFLSYLLLFKAWRLWVNDCVRVRRFMRADEGKRAGAGEDMADDGLLLEDESTARCSAPIPYPPSLLHLLHLLLLLLILILPLLFHHRRRLLFMRLPHLPPCLPQEGLRQYADLHWC